MSRVALWLVPAEPWHARLAGRIAALARAHQALPFEPHITLHLGLAASSEALADRLAQLVTHVSPLELRAGACGHGSEHFKTLFLTFDDARLPALQARAAAELGLSTGYELHPHLSLLYRGGLPPAQREALAREHDLSGLLLRFDRLVIVRPPPGEDFSDQRGWNTSLRGTLAGAGDAAHE
jgi:hypothetical protein